jgi:hypothetical protein
MSNHSAAPPGGTGGSGFDGDIGPGGHDLESLTQLPCETSHCAGCGVEYGQQARPVAKAALIEPEGVVAYTLCQDCATRWPRDRNFRLQLEHKAYGLLANTEPKSKTVPRAPTPKDTLKMARIDGTKRPGRPQGVVMDLRRPPQNRAQRRFLARLQRRAAKR